MKALAAVNIHQYERTTEALAEYNRAVEIGFQIVLRARPDRIINAHLVRRDRVIAVVFGSDQGMCGQFNEQIVLHTTQGLKVSNSGPHHHVVLAVGARVAALLKETGLLVEETFPVPGSVAGIVRLVEDLLAEIEVWRERLTVDHVIAYYNAHISNTAFVPREVGLLPIDLEWLNRLQARAWPDRTIPTFTMDWDRLFSALIWQYLFVSIFRALAESLTSENAARLVAMERAEKNIEERLQELSLRYQQQRQASITEELLEIVAGFEALAPDRK